MKRILFIGGSINQTKMVHQIASHLQQSYDCLFTPYYGDGFVQQLANKGWLDNTILAGQAKSATLNYFKTHQLPVDERGQKNNYDLIVTTSDNIIPKNIKNKKIVLIQEGMMVPDDWKYYVVKNLGLPQYLGNTAMTGLSDNYLKFCVASEGWKSIFQEKGVRSKKMEATGIPNFDNLEVYKKNNFPHHDFVLGATSCLRETLQYENRKKFIFKVLDIANGDPVIFKLHPNENKERAIREIKKYAPKSLIYTKGDIIPMIANCKTLVTKYSSVLMTALGLKKTVYSDIPQKKIEKMRPIQNNGNSAKRIASICSAILN